MKLILFNQQPGELILVILTGLLVGSIINIFAYHLPRQLQNNWSQRYRHWRLHCVNCAAVTSSWMHWPLLRAVAGKCLHCAQAVGQRYHWVELGTATLTLIIVLRFGLQLSTIAILLLTWGLLLLALIDASHYLLPDCLTLPLLWLGLLLNSFGIWVSPEQAIIGAASGYGCLWLVNSLYAITCHQRGIGQGDYKLLAVLGAWWGLYPLAIILFLSAVSAALITVIAIFLGKRDYSAPLPFAPYIVSSGLVVMLMMR